MAHVLAVSNSPTVARPIGPPQSWATRVTPLNARASTKAVTTYLQKSRREAVGGAQREAERPGDDGRDGAR